MFCELHNASVTDQDSALLLLRVLTKRVISLYDIVCFYLLLSLSCICVFFSLKYVCFTNSICSQRQQLIEYRCCHHHREVKHSEMSTAQGTQIYIYIYIYVRWSWSWSFGSCLDLEFVFVRDLLNPSYSTRTHEQFD